MTFEQLGAYFAAVVTICGILASIFPQQWAVTKWLTKIGALTFRAATKVPSAIALLLVAFILQGCSLEAARNRRIAAHPTAMVEPRTQATQSACAFFDGVHIGGDWVAGVSAGTGTAAASIAAATDGKLAQGMTITGIVAGGVSLFAIGAATQSEKSWSEACQ